MRRWQNGPEARAIMLFRKTGVVSRQNHRDKYIMSTKCNILYPKNRMIQIVTTVLWKVKSTVKPRYSATAKNRVLNMVTTVLWKVHWRSLNAHKFLWTKIPPYAIFRFPATHDKEPQTSVNSGAISAFVLLLSGNGGIFIWRFLTEIGVLGFDKIQTVCSWTERSNR